MPTYPDLRFDIETDAEAELQRDRLAARLKTTHPSLKALVTCEYDDPCGAASCPLCTHRYRERVLPQLAPFFDQPLDRLRFVTMYVDLVPEGQLDQGDALTLRDSLRRTIARADTLGHGLAIGGLEPEWRGAERKWLLHMHVIAGDIDTQCWARVRSVLRKRANKETHKATRSSARRVLRIDAVEELAYQLSYCIKFMTYDRLARADNGTKGKAVSLRGEPLNELIKWRSQYSPDEFLFLYGVKRQNGHFVRHTRDACVGARSHALISPASPASNPRRSPKFTGRALTYARGIVEC